MFRTRTIAAIIAVILALAAFPYSGIAENLDREIERYRKSVNKNPGDLEHHRKLVIDYVQAGKIDVPIKVYEAAYERDPEHPVVQYALGLAYLKSGDKSRLGKALDLLEQSSEKLESPWVKLALGETHAALGNDIKALSILEPISGSEVEDIDIALIEIHRRRKEYDKALSSAESLLKRDDESARAHYLKGLILLDQAAFNEARVSLERAIKLDYKFADAYYRLGQLYALLDEPAEAIRMYKLGRNFDPHNSQARYELASIFLDKGQEELAVASVRSAFAANPEASRYAEMLKDADYARTIEVLNQYLKAHPEDQSARFIKAKINAIIGNTEEAKVELEQVSRVIPEINPLRKNVHVELGRIYEREDPTKAVEEYKQAADLGAVEVELLQKLLETYRQEQKTDKFLETAEKLLNVNPQNAPLEFEIALIYEDRALKAQKAGNAEEYQRYMKKTLDHCAKAARIDNTNIEYSLKLAELYESQGQIKAFRIYSDLIDYYPDNPDLYYRRANYMLNFKVGNQKILMYEMSDIIEDLETALRIDPNHSPSRYLLALVYEREGDMENAIAQAEKAVAADPQNVDALLWLARKYSGMNREADAIALFEKALTIRPDDVNAIKDYAFLVLEHDETRIDDARKHLARAVELKPDDPLLLMNYAYSLYLNRNLPMAIKYYREALSRDESSTRIRYNLALAYEADGQIDKADELWREIIELEPDGRYAEIARRKLGQ